MVSVKDKLCPSFLSLICPDSCSCKASEDSCLILLCLDKASSLTPPDLPKALHN